MPNNVLFKATVRFTQTVMPGTNYQQGSVETESGFVTAPDATTAEKIVREYYERMNSNTHVVSVAACKVTPADKSSTGFFVRFNLSANGDVTNTKELVLAMTCRAYYTASCQVPANLSLEDAIEYAKAHYDLSELTADPDSIELLSGEEVVHTAECRFSDGTEVG